MRSNFKGWAFICYYDPFGRRLRKAVDGAITYFLYSEEGLIGEYDSAGIESKAYGYAPDSSWTTAPLFQKSGGVYFWYHNDHLGTPQKMTATDGTVVWSAVYDSFGNAQIGVDTVENNLRFPGQYFDAETGLHYNWNRYYDPEIGRYLRADPAEDGLNLYVYVLNNPLTGIDPEGLRERDASDVGFTQSKLLADSGQIISDKGYVQDNPGNDFHYSGISYGGSMILVDFTGKGTETNTSVSTTFFGGGVHFNFETPNYAARDHSNDLNVAVGLGEYAGFGYVLGPGGEVDRFSINVGLALASPITFSTSVQHFAEIIGDGLYNLFH